MNDKMQRAIEAVRMVGREYMAGASRTVAEFGQPKPDTTCMSCGVAIKRRPNGPRKQRCPVCRKEHRAKYNRERYQRLKGASRDNR